MKDLIRSERLRIRGVAIIGAAPLLPLPSRTAFRRPGRPGLLRLTEPGMER
jgi:hypothetical protein